MRFEAPSPTVTASLLARCPASSPQAHAAGEGAGRGRERRRRSGLGIAIGPSLMAGGDDEYYMSEDGWSVCSGDGSRSVHVEHTVAITADGPVILTVP